MAKGWPKSKASATLPGARQDDDRLNRTIEAQLGGAITCRLRKTEEIGYLLHLARELSVSSIDVTLSTRFPAMTITAGDATTFADLGIKESKKPSL